MSAPEIRGDTLRRAGRVPETPFAVRSADGTSLIVTQLLRVLPGKRIVGAATWQGRRVLAKLFVARFNRRHWRREAEGVAALHAAGLPTPALLAAGDIVGGGRFLLTEFLDGAEPLTAAWDAAVAVHAIDRLHAAFALLGRLHAAELLHSDLHPGNFLTRGDALWLIDGDGIVRATGSAYAVARQVEDNLALLVAQLPVSWERHLDALLAAYATGQSRWRPERAKILAATERLRAWRLKRYLAKTLRDCSLFAVRKTTSRFQVVVRSEQARLADVLEYPDGGIAHGMQLKDGNTCTVARIDVGGQPLVIKRYNLKSIGHALSRFWRPSRAWRSWLAAHRLAFHGIATPAPLALIEERLGPLRGRAFLFTAYCAGTSLLEHFDPHRIPGEREAVALDNLFATLYRLRISHGDLKANNLLWDGEQLIVIDLDSLTQHTQASSFARAWRRDRDRFLRNWPASSALVRWLDQRMPGG